MTKVSGTSEPVAQEIRGAAMWLTLNRPEAFNSLSSELLSELRAALGRAASSDSIRAVVISAQGPAFCAGADLEHVLRTTAGDEGTLSAFLRQANEVFTFLEWMPKPVIAAVDGLAIAGGLELVLCCDIVFATERAKFGDGHSNYGLLPGGGASVRLPRRVGESRAKAMLFSGEVVSAEDLARTDLIYRVVDHSRLVASIEEFCDLLAMKSPLAHERVKTLVQEAVDQGGSAALQRELRAVALHEASFDFREGLAAFAEKRAPRFRGR